MIVSTVKVIVLASLMLPCRVFCAEGDDDAFSLPNASAITFLGIEAEAARLRNNVFAVQSQIQTLDSEGKATNNWKSIGSGVFFRRQDRIIVGVTCRHVVGGLVNHSKTNQTVRYASTNKPVCHVGIEVRPGIYDRLSVFTVVLDGTKDLAAVFPLVEQSIVQALSGSTNRAVTEFLRRDRVAEDPEIALGVGLITMGYPLGQGVYENENSPIVRFGIVAQNVRNGQFLIDGSASPGNSGSPIVAPRTGRFLGIISAHLNEPIELKDQNANTVALLPYNAGLAVAISAGEVSRFLEFVDAVPLPGPPAGYIYPKALPDETAIQRDAK